MLRNLSLVAFQKTLDSTSIAPSRHLDSFDRYQTKEAVSLFMRLLTSQGYFKTVWSR